VDNLWIVQTGLFMFPLIKPGLEYNLIPDKAYNYVPGIQFLIMYQILCLIRHIIGGHHSPPKDSGEPA